MAPKMADSDLELDSLISQQRAGCTLSQPFYLDSRIFQLEKHRVLMREWLFAGHVSQLREPGDYFVYEVAGESIILSRDELDNVNAMVNVCRHRGSRVCVDSAGNEKRFVCPYHGWVYELDGALRSARMMPAEFDLTAHGLHRLRVELFQGLIFVSFADVPVEFAPLRNELEACFKPFGFERAKVAAAKSYRVAANWKLVMENYVECYHCVTAHPEFSRSHSNKLPRDRNPELQQRMRVRAGEAGICCEVVAHGFSDDSFDNLSYGHDRFALYEGYETGSETGAPLAPLMGDIVAFDGGASNGQFGALCYLLAYCDHCVIYRFTPTNVNSADMDLFWLVNESARAGIDYDVDELMWLWDVTSVADQTIIERNQAGVSSAFYQPGPYSPMETWASKFRDWYLRALGTSESGVTL
jgi:phenylpropionate dioxygenase-like ring-hydroxylating dioxygenase large terminal subunit